MRPKDTLRMVFNSMRYKRLRTVLTIIGILVGPAAIVALLSITTGFTGSITSQLSKIGATTVYVTASNGNITDATVASMAKLRNVSAAVPYYSFSANVHGNSSESVTVYAVDAEKLQSIMPSLGLLSGSTPGTSGGALLGYSVAYPNVTGEVNETPGKVVSLDISKSAGSQSVSIGGAGFFTGSFGRGASSQKKTYSFMVVGVYSKFGQGFFVSPDTSVFVPLSEGRIIKQSSNYTGVFVQVSNATSVNGTVAALESLLGNSARVVPISSLLGSIQSIESSASMLLIGIAGISFIVAFMGIMTTMFTAVTERTREIGVMKALGFTSRQVMILFVTESLIIGFIGGSIGSVAGGAVGYFGAPLLTSAFNRNSAAPQAPAAVRSSSTTTRVASASSAAAARSSGQQSSTGFSVSGSIDPGLMLEVTLLTSLMGAIAGLVPAWRASRLIPAEALRTL